MRQRKKSNLIKILFFLALVFAICILFICNNSSRIKNYKTTISNTDSIICDGMITGRSSFRISDENAKNIKQYFINSNWEEMKTIDDIVPYEYLVFKDLTIGILKNDNDNEILLIKVRGGNVYEIKGGEYINIDKFLV